MKAMKLGWIIFALTSIFSAYVIGASPSGIEIPVHWNIDGEPDRYGSVYEAMLVGPAVMLLILTVMSVLKYIEPRQENLKKSDTARGWIALATVLLMLIITAANYFIIQGYEVPMVRVVFSGIGFMFMILGNFFQKIRSNFFLGLRTPWTLSSDEVWRQTHRLAGRLFMVVGAVLVPIAWVFSEDGLTYTMAFLVIPATLIPVIYSWWLWKKEQNA